MSQRYQNTVLIRNVHKNKQKTPEKHQMKQDDSGKIVIHEMKSLISIVYTSLLFWRSIISEKGSFT